MIPNRNFFCLSEISRLEFDNLRGDVDCLDALNTGHQHLTNNLRSRVIQLEGEQKILKEALIELIKVNIKLSASLATSFRRPVTEKDVEILEKALNNLTLNEQS